MVRAKDMKRETGKDGATSAGAYFDLGPHTHPITTRSPDAQIWFNRGLVWAYGFNHDEAVVCFRHAAAADPDCAMAYWGEAYASGPYYNMTWDFFGPAEVRDATRICHHAAQRALALADTCSGLEQALIGALNQRFPVGHVVDPDTFASWGDAYADAMREVHARFPESLDVIALFAEAMMTRTPWKLWNVDLGQPAAGADTLEVLEVLEAGLSLSEPADSGNPPHVGILHMYIHALEMSPHPERALPAADALRDRSPDNGHLQHMPAHIYALCGLYSSAITVSNHAIAADDKYLQHTGPYNFYTTNRCHDLHMKIHAAMLAGRYAAAHEAAEKMRETLTEDLLRIDKPYMAMLLEDYHAMLVHVPVRFGHWQEIVDMALPNDPQLYPVSIAMMHYAKGVAHAALGNVGLAEQEASQFGAACAAVPADRVYANNLASEVLEIANAMLAGEIAYRRAEFEAAFTHLREAVRLDDALNYSEPWPWMHPPRHALGALLLEQDHPAEAASVYRADLGIEPTIARCRQNPENVWSLHGYVECLRRCGEQRELALVQQRLDQALALADVTINASCCCRTQGQRA